MRWPYIVISNEPRTRVARSWKDAHGEVQFEHESLGWFLVLSDGRDPHIGTITFRAPERLPFESGETIYLMLEREGEAS